MRLKLFTIQYLLIVSIFILQIPVAYANSLTQAQINQIKSLAPEQQRLLAAQYGVDIGDLSAKTEPQKLTQPTLLVSKLAEKNDSTTPVATPVATPVVPKSKTPKIFGHDLFSGVPTTFAPATDIPIPANYVVGPGDSVDLYLFGQTNETHSLLVNRDGRINIPNIGPLVVAGLSFTELRQQIEAEIANKAIGWDVLVSLGELRSMRIYIMGEANQPGSYTVSALSTITNALFVSGGVTERGSLRNIQVKRAGELVAEFDLYELLLHGDTTNDIRLLPNDVILIPAIGDTVHIKGSVKRNAWFEIKHENTLADVLSLAGGYLANTQLPMSKLERIAENGQRIVLNIDLSQSDVLLQGIQNGDVIEVNSVLDSVEQQVEIAGISLRTGLYEYYPGLTASALFTSIRDFPNNVDIDYSLVRSQDPVSGLVSYQQFSLVEILRKNEDVSLKNRDYILFFANNNERDEFLAEELSTINAQQRLLPKKSIIKVSGAAIYTGTFPFTKDMTLADVLMATGGMAANADNDIAVIARKGQQNILSTIIVNLQEQSARQIAITAEDHILFLPDDETRMTLLEPLIEKLSMQSTVAIAENTVTINGEVRYPGVYPYSSNMNLELLVLLAGGMTQGGYTSNIEISRKQANDSYEYDMLAVSMEAQDFSAKSTILAEGDIVSVRKTPSFYDKRFITLAGEFKFPSKYLFKDGDSLYEVIQRAGGFTDYANLNNSIFVREEIAIQQSQQLELLTEKIEKQLEITKLSKSINTLGVSESTVDDTDIDTLIDTIDRKGLGRVVLDLASIIYGAKTNVVLQNNDYLHVGTQSEIVSVIGEVNMNNAIFYHPDLGLDDYINNSGGLTEYADNGGIYIIKSNGAMEIADSSFWGTPRFVIEAGDTIVVPMDVSLEDNLSTWQKITQIMYNSAVAVAAIKAL